MNDRRAPGTALLHPAFALSLFVLIVNDHWLKHAHPGWWSGKLSDFAAVLILPLFLQALFELTALRLTRRSPSAVATNRALRVSLLVTLVAYALPEVWLPAEIAYRYGVGALQWPFQCIGALLGGDAAPSLRPVRATADVTDLLAVPMLLVAFRIGHRRDPSAERLASKRRTAILAGACGLLSLAWPAGARAADDQAATEKPGERTHDGFFFEFQLGPGAIFVDSTESVSNGFRQSIPSTAQGLAFPAGALEFGGTLPDSGLVLGGRLGRALAREPVIGTLGERFEIRDLELVLFEAEAIVKYYPDRRHGFHFGGAVGLASLELQEAGSEQQRGPCGSFEIGHSLWIARQFSAGGAARLFYARLSGDERGETSVLMPGVFATVTWH